MLDFTENSEEFISLGSGQVASPRPSPRNKRMLDSWLQQWRVIGKSVSNFKPLEKGDFTKNSV